MTVEWLIHLLQQQNPKATAYIWTFRYGMEDNEVIGADPARSNIEEVKTFPGEKGVYIVEQSEFNWF